MCWPSITMVFKNYLECVPVATDLAQSVVPKQQHQHHLGSHRRCKFSDPRHASFSYTRLPLPPSVTSLRSCPRSPPHFLASHSAPAHSRWTSILGGPQAVLPAPSQVTTLRNLVYAVTSPPLRAYSPSRSTAGIHSSLMLRVELPIWASDKETYRRKTREGHRLTVLLHLLSLPFSHQVPFHIFQVSPGLPPPPAPGNPTPNPTPLRG